MDNLDFLDGETPVEPTAAVSTPEPAAPEPTASQEGQPRGSDGKFLPKGQTEPEPATAQPSPQAPESPPVAAQPTPEPTRAPDGFVPVAALTELRREFQAFKQAAQRPPEPAPDPYENFEAYEAYQAEQRNGERFEWSFDLLTARHGEETAGQVREWAGRKAEADPLFYQRALSTRDPFGFAFEEYQRDQALALLSDPKLLEQFKAWQAGTGPAPISQAAPAAPPQSPTPPRSLASAPSAGGAKPGETPVGPGVAFDSVFGT